MATTSLSFDQAATNQAVTAPIVGQDFLHIVGTAEELNALDQDGNNALHRACIDNKIDVARAVIPQVDVNAPTARGKTALALSFDAGLQAHNQESIFDLLIAQPAINVDSILPKLQYYASSPYGDALLKKILQTPHIDLPNNLITVYASNEDPSALYGIRTLLQDARFDLDGESFRRACEHYAKLFTYDEQPELNLATNVAASIAYLLFAHHDRHIPLPQMAHWQFALPVSDWMKIADANERIAYIRATNYEEARYYDEVIAPAYQASLAVPGAQPHAETAFAVEFGAGIEY